MADSLANDPGASLIVVLGLLARHPAGVDVSELSQTAVSGHWSLLGNPSGSLT